MPTPTLTPAQLSHLTSVYRHPDFRASGSGIAVMERLRDLGLIAPHGYRSATILPAGIDALRALLPADEMDRLTEVRRTADLYARVQADTAPERDALRKVRFDASRAIDRLSLLVVDASDVDPEAVRAALGEVSLAADRVRGARVVLAEAERAARVRHGLVEGGAK